MHALANWSWTSTLAVCFGLIVVVRLGRIQRGFSRLIAEQIITNTELNEANDNLKSVHSALAILKSDLENQHIEATDWTREAATHLFSIDAELSRVLQARYPSQNDFRS